VSNRSPSTSAVGDGVYPSSVFIDANGDGKLDLFLGSNGYAPNIRWGSSDLTTSKIMLNDGTGHFTNSGYAMASFGERNKVVGSTVADLNGDGRQDLILSVALNDYKDGGQVRILINNGKGFTDETSRLLGDAGRTPVSVYRVLLGDMNGDGATDLILSHGPENPILLNDGSGNFVAMPGLLPGQGKYDKFAVGDLNGDGALDVVTQAPVSDQRVQEVVRVWLSQSPQTSQDGGSGNDGLMGHGTQNNILHGLLGNDTVVGGAGRDYLRGEEGDDILFGGAEFDDVHGNQGSDTLHGGFGDDWVVGGKDNDLLYGQGGWDIVYGNLGNDTCEGGDYIDWVRGGQGDDVVRGGGGDDWLWGDRGSDTISGGSGADRFHFHAEAGIDRITDFNAAEGDRIRIESGTHTVSLQGSDTVLDFGGGNQMVLVGVTGFSPVWIV
jgi:Ca2+-binding RTX toxin-like protein